MRSKLKQAIIETKEHLNLNHQREDDDGDFTDDDALDELMQECGQDRHGTCSMAGSEYCD